MGHNNPATHREYMRKRYWARRPGRSPHQFRDRVRNGWLERKCRKCGDWALMSEFVPNRNVKHGRLYTCKVCHAMYKAQKRKALAARRAA